MLSTKLFNTVYGCLWIKRGYNWIIKIVGGMEDRSDDTLNNLLFVYWNQKFVNLEHKTTFKTN